MWLEPCYFEYFAGKFISQRLTQTLCVEKKSLSNPYLNTIGPFPDMIAVTISSFASLSKHPICSPLKAYGMSEWTEYLISLVILSIANDRTDLYELTSL